MKGNCKAITKNGKRCSRKTKFYYCKQHWKRKRLKGKAIIFTFLSFVLLIASGIVDIPDAYRKIKSFIISDNYIISEEDNNIRGILLNKANLNSFGLMNLSYGVKDSKSIIGSIPRDYTANYVCLFGWFDEKCNFKYRINSTDRFLISAKIYNISEEVVGVIEDNQFILNKNNMFSWNFDDTAFEVIDSDFNVIMSFVYDSSNTIRFQGLVPDTKKIYVVKDNGFISFSKSNKEDVKRELEKLRPVFEYSGKDWFGRRKIY